MEKERKTPKEYFLTKLYTALCEFEDTTGVEVHTIRIERVSTQNIGANKKTIMINNYDLELK